MLLWSLKSLEKFQKSQKVSEPQLSCLFLFLFAMLITTEPDPLMAGKAALQSYTAHV